jgi:integrase
MWPPREFGKRIGTLLGKLGDEYWPLAATLAYAALRLSEALALRWRDIDLDACHLTVREQVDRAGKPVPLKTTASAATLDLLPALARELRAHRARRAGLGIQLVRADAFVLATLDGKPQHQRNALRAIVTAAGKAKLGHVTAHDLRHSLVANVLEAKRDSLGAKLAQGQRVVATSGLGRSRPFGGGMGRRRLGVQLLSAAGAFKRGRPALLGGPSSRS